MLQLLKSVCPRACAPHKEKSLQREAHTPQLDSSPCSPQLEKSPRSNKNPAFNCGSQALAQGPSLVAQLVKNLPTMQEFSSVTQSCPTLCDPVDCSTPGLPVHHQLPEPTQTRVHHVGDAIQPSHPLSSPSLPTFNLSQHQGLFQ